jgi:dCTP deaminase
MLIVGENLRSLVEQHTITSDQRGFDMNSLTLTLDRDFITIEPDEDAVLTYGHVIPPEWVHERSIPDEGIVLAPKTSILGCSHEIIKMPAGYFGFLQTKGSLARLFVLVNLCDGQVEAGYTGKVTFEISNLATFPIRIHPHQPVAQLFIFKTSTRLVELYNGRYQGATKPTIQLPNA